MRALVVLIVDRDATSLIRITRLVDVAMARLGRVASVVRHREWAENYGTEADAAHERWVRQVRDRLQAGGDVIVATLRPWECFVAGNACKASFRHLMVVCEESLGYELGVRFMLEVERWLGVPLQRRIVLTTSLDARGYDHVHAAHRIPKHLPDEELITALCRILRKTLRVRRT
ncbi:MAG: hypothetical protein V1745_02420 [Patescibacteria group bacterium]